MKAHVAAVLTLALALVTLTALMPPREGGIRGLVYYPPRPPVVNFLKTDLPTYRASGDYREFHFPQPPTSMEIGNAISQQGLRNFHIMGWDLLFIPYDSGDDTIKYSAIATQRGAREYYYLVSISGAQIRVSRPITIHICADGSEIDPDSTCPDGSKSEPLIKR
jgi:hypothetical protein